MSVAINTYDGPGRARKACPNGHYVHVRSGECVCGHIFTAVPKVKLVNIEPKEKPTKEIQTYDEPGKGRRKCPNCPKYISGRAPKCVCGFDFTGYVSPLKEKVVKTYDEVGPGRKQCPCGTIVGNKTAACPSCSHQFIQEQTPEINCITDDGEEEVQQELSYAARLGYPGYAVTYTPAGECPFRLYTAEEGDVVDWIKKIHNYYIARRQVLAPSGFSYYARDFFDVFSQDYNNVKRIIKSYFGPYTK